MCCYHVGQGWHQLTTVSKANGGCSRPRCLQSEMRCQSSWVLQAEESQATGASSTIFQEQFKYVTLWLEEFEDLRSLSLLSSASAIMAIEVLQV